MKLEDIGKRIKKYREEVGLTQAQVGEYLSLDQSMVAKMEKGERTINSDVIKKLCALFCCTSDDILDGSNLNSKCKISFRSNSLASNDLKALAIINRIVLNQAEMDETLGGM